MIFNKFNSINDQKMPITTNSKIGISQTKHQYLVALGCFRETLNKLFYEFDHSIKILIWDDPNITEDELNEIHDMNKEFKRIYDNITVWKNSVLHQIQVLEDRALLLCNNGDIPSKIQSKIAECRKIGNKISITDLAIYCGLKDKNSNGIYLIETIIYDDDPAGSWRRDMYEDMAMTLNKENFYPFKYFDIAMSELDDLINKEERKISNKGEFQVKTGKKILIIPQIFFPKKWKTHEEKIWKIQARIKNLLSRETWLDNGWKNEIRTITETLNVLEQSLWTEDQHKLEVIETIKNEIELLLNRKIPEVKSNITHNKWEIMENEWEIIPSIENQETIHYLENLLDKKFTYSLSSTKLNSRNTVWDGTFLRIIFRPFIRYIINELLSKNQVDATIISWNEIATKYEQNVENNHAGQNSFIKILKGNTEKNHFSRIFWELIGILEIFSQWNYLEGQTEKDKFQNIISILRENL